VPPKSLSLCQRIVNYMSVNIVNHLTPNGHLVVKPHS